MGPAAGSTAMAAAVVVLLIGRRRGARAAQGHRLPGPQVWQAVPPAAWVVFAAAFCWIALGPLGALVAAAAGTAAAVVVPARAEQRRAAARDAAAPATIDLFRMCVGAGLTVPAALPVAARRAPSAVRPLWHAAAAHTAKGLPLAEALADVARQAGPGSEALIAALGQSARTGGDLVPVLDDLAATSRDRRRRSAQAAARRLPVTMLLPLAACILPAAIVLAVVPVLVVSLSSLAL